MLKTLSLTPDEARDDSENEDASESRMLRALNALSSNAPPADADGRHSGESRHNGGQMRGKQRDSGRNDGAAAHFARARHRFVKDGEVPVVHMAAPRPREAPAAATRPDADLLRLQQMLDEQRLRADQNERAKQDAMAQLKALQTKYAHAEMALADALGLAESRLGEIAALSERLTQATEPTLPTAAETGARRIPRVRLQHEPKEAAEPEPEPVQWWLTPSHGGAKRARRTGAAG